MNIAMRVLRTKTNATNIGVLIANVEIHAADISMPQGSFFTDLGAKSP